jgi:DNA polymerase I-like protein with 3'-5' exonuclease and polymerase domains
MATEHQRVLKEALDAKLDPHTAVAAWLYDVPAEQVTPEQRRRTKHLNFMELYGVQGTWGRGP